MFRHFIYSLLFLTGLLLAAPLLTCAQDTSDDIHSLHTVLENIYKEMFPLCGKLIDVGRVIAGFAATWYIGVRVWKHIARAEPVDFFPLFRPFCLGMVIVYFEYVIAIINGVMEPTVKGTAALVDESNKTVQMLLEAKERAIRQSDTWKAMVGESGDGDYDLWMQYAHKDAVEEGTAWWEDIKYSMQFSLSKGFYRMKNSLKQFFSEALQILYEAAALCINTIRTFNMIVLAIIGPLVVAISVFDGFQHTLVVWLARYINVFLWLPVCNIFSAITSKIMENMLKIDIQQVQLTGDTFFSGTDIGYIIFMIIACVGYGCVPNVAGHIINVGDRSAIADKVTRMLGSVIKSGASSGGYIVGGPVGAATAGMVADALVDAGSNTNAGFARIGTAGGYFKNGPGSGYQRDKIGG